MKHLLIMFVLVALCGCAAKPKTYLSHIGKNPSYLVLQPDGSYLIEQHFKYTIVESGRWWALEESIIALLPNDPVKQAHFARLATDHSSPFGYILYPDLRSAYTSDLWLGASSNVLWKDITTLGSTQQINPSEDQQP